MIIILGILYMISIIFWTFIATIIIEIIIGVSLYFANVIKVTFPSKGNISACEPNKSKMCFC